MHTLTPTQQALAKARLRAGSMTTANGCIVWTGKADRNGYCRIRFEGSRIGVHRLARMADGTRYRRTLTPGWHVHHSCENPRCVNPDHLREMSPKGHAMVHVYKRALRRRWLLANGITP